MRIRRAAVGAVLLLAAGAADAQGIRHSEDQLVELTGVLVTATGADDALRTTPHGISVITADDIARSTAVSLPDLLSREANLNLQSYFGNASYATIDMRGMGATATSNVLVLVDGVRMNEIDLSGPDLSTVPLSQIERVEIVRGGGAVRYGDGAVGGVINIVTKRARTGTPELSGGARFGSYDTTELRARATAGTGPLAAAVDVSGLETDGYRKNGDVSARDGALELRLTPTGDADVFELFGRAAVHHDISGLPGPVSLAAFEGDSDDRRATQAPFDESETDDQRYVLGANLGLGNGQLQLQAAYGERDNPFIIGYTDLLSREDQQWQVGTRRTELNARYERPFAAFGYSHVFTAGFDLLQADYTRYENGQYRVGSARRTGEVDSSAYYAAATLRAPYRLTVNAGIRFGRFSTHEADELYTSTCDTVFETVLVDVDPGPGVILIPIQVPRQVNCVDAYTPRAEQSNVWHNQGANLGLTWEPTAGLTLFAGVTQTFRNPNVDELLFAATDLRPQTGTTFELGGRYALGQRLELATTLFHMAVEDEIVYAVDPITDLAVNRNLEDPTRRIGAELEARWQASESVALRGSLGYVQARIPDAGTTIPLVPSTTANAEVDWALRHWLHWGFSARYVSGRYDGNDFGNTLYRRLPAYTVCDMAVRLKRGDFEVSAGINNLFDEVYSTIAYSETYYPMPERNYFVAVKARF